MVYNNEVILTFYLILAPISSCFGQAFRSKPTPTPYHDWDYLLFSQRWPITSCAMWEEAKKDNTCNLPKNKNLWTIHGVWPTKTGTEGPWFCPSAIHWNPEALQSLLDELNVYWINVEGNTKPNSFWAHEWNKHGTCASVLPQMDSVKNYFETGLELNRKYDISMILSKGGIIPNNKGYTVQDIFTAIKSYTNKNSMIQCVVDKKSKDSLISEIRICFNKSLEVIDCDSANPVHKLKNGVISNCSPKKPIMYFGTVPMTANSYEVDYVDDAVITVQRHYEEQMYYLSIYNFLKFLMWFTV